MTASAEPQPVDFRKPRRLAPFARRTVDDWYARSTALTMENWKQHITDPPQLTHAGSEVLLARDALQRVADPAWGCVLWIGPTAFATLFTFPLRQILLLVNAMIAAGGEENPEERPLTAVEESLAQLVMYEFARGLSEGWPGQTPMAVETGAVEPRPCRSRVFAPHTPVYLSTFRISQSLGELDCQWILPEDELAETVARYSQESGGQTPVASHALLDHLARQMPVELVVELGRVALTMPQLSRLDVGDVLVLGQSITDPLTARVGGQVKYRGWAGRNGVRQGFQISALVNDP